MKRLITILAAAALLAACAQGARSGGPVATGTAPMATPPRHSPTANHSPSGPAATPPSPSNTGTTSPATSPSTEPGTVTLEVWFDSAGGNRLARVYRTLPATSAVGTAALEALLQGPTDAEVAAGTGTQIPPGTTLLGLSIAGGVATVNLSNDYFSGGSAVSEWARLGQVVFTISQFHTVSGVTIELDGNPIQPFDIDGKSLDRPWTRDDFELIVPAILVDSPTTGQAVTSPIEVTGTADVFEAVVSLRLLDANGHEIANTTTMATCGSGCRGTYSTELPYGVDHDQRGTLEVFEASAKDGSPINVVEVPVTLSA